MQAITPTATQIHEITAGDPIDSPRTVDRRIGWSATTRWRMARVGKFPKAIRLSPGRIGYRRSDVDRWLAERAADVR